MKISKADLTNTYFGRKNKSSDGKFLPSKKTMVLCTSLLAAAPLNKSDSVVNDSFVKFEPIAQENIREEKLTWDTIPDYQKLLTVFYSSLALMLLVSIFTSKEKDNNQDKYKY